MEGRPRYAPHCFRELGVSRMIDVQLTDDEVTTIMVALDNYRYERETEFVYTGDPQDQQDAGSAEWCWQKLHAVQQKFRAVSQNLEFPE